MDIGLVHPNESNRARDRIHQSLRRGSVRAVKTDYKVPCNRRVAGKSKPIGIPDHTAVSGKPRTRVKAQHIRARRQIRTYR